MDKQITIAYLSDVHTDYKQNLYFLEEVIQHMENISPALLILAGDVSHHLKKFALTLSLFDKLSCPKLFVPGNHDIWINDDQLTSFDKYNKVLPELCQSLNWHYLPGNPFRINETAVIIGNMGWYDYSLAHKPLNLTKQDYERKVYDGLGWMDRIYAKCVHGNQTMSDQEVVDWLLSTMEEDIQKVKQFPQAIVVMHHIPFDRIMFRMVPPSRITFLRAFMGSKLFGELILKYPFITHVITGHRHFASDKTIHNIHCLANPMGYPKERRMTTPPSHYVRCFQI